MCVAKPSGYMVSTSGSPTCGMYWAICTGAPVQSKSSRLPITSPSSSTYRGPSASSEPEVRTIEALTAREREVLAHMAEGLSNKLIAVEHAVVLSTRL